MNECFLLDGFLISSKCFKAPHVTSVVLTVSHVGRLSCLEHLEDKESSLCFGHLYSQKLHQGHGMNVSVVIGWICDIVMFEYKDDL